jgi:hypothetical protein
MGYGTERHDWKLRELESMESFSLSLGCSVAGKPPVIESIVANHIDGTISDAELLLWLQQHLGRWAVFFGSFSPRGARSKGDQQPDGRVAHNQEAFEHPWC